MGRTLIIVGLTVAVVGVVVVLGEKVGIRLGRLPGDVVIERKGGTLYIPIVTCLLVSGVLTMLGWLFGRR